MKVITVEKARKIHIEECNPFSFLIYPNVQMTIMGSFGNIHLAERVIVRDNFLSSETLDVVL